MQTASMCHLCGKPAYGGVGGVGGEILPICLNHYMQLAAIENERQRQHNDEMRHNMAMLNLASAQMNAVSGMDLSPMVAVPPPAPASSFTSVSVSNSTVGVINTATVGQIVNSINAIPQGMPAKDALAEFTEAVTQSAALTDEGKKNFLDQLAIVSEQAATVPEKRKTAVVMPILAAIAQVATTVAGLAEAWEKVEPIIKAHFGF